MRAGAAFLRTRGSAAFPHPRRPQCRALCPALLSARPQEQARAGVSEKPPAEGDTPAAPPPGKRRAGAGGGGGGGERGSEARGGGGARGRVPER